MSSDDEKRDEPTELEHKMLDELADKIRELPQDRQKLLLDELRREHTWSVKEVAAHFHRDEETVRRWIREHKIKARKVGRSYEIPGSEVVKMEDGDE